jgi:hypothetical protein
LGSTGGHGMWTNHHGSSVAKVDDFLLVMLGER